MVIIVGEIDAAIIPRIAITASLGFETNQGSFGSIARGMLEERSGRVGSILAAIEDGSEGRHTTRLAEPIEHAGALVITKVRPGGRVGVVNGWSSVLEKFGFKERQRVFE